MLVRPLGDHSRAGMDASKARPVSWQENIIIRVSGGLSPGRWYQVLGLYWH